MAENKKLRDLLKHPGSVGCQCWTFSLKTSLDFYGRGDLFLDIITVDAARNVRVFEKDQTYTM